MKLQPKGRKSLLTQAKNLGVKDPDTLDDNQLRIVVGLYRKAKDLRRFAEVLGIKLPEPEKVANVGTLERIFLDEVERRLAKVKVRSVIRYDGKEWVVTKITRTRGVSQSRHVYVIKPVGGGNHRVLPDTTILKGAEF